ncbi:murein biosynthesis integral membrane protein MurJ [Amphibacillus sp. Q70]|uniref:murein biosynthesis integral membrane protein MurJ n=1 Tax=Amphibacillus sp. Q70 TaxID=3453416 RepID=UPI003F8669D0
MKKTVLLIIILTVISKVIGLSREITLSYFYGATSVSDAYLIALIIPTVIFTFVGNAISTGYIPMYNKIAFEFDKNKANTYTNNLINILGVFSCALIFFCYMFTEQLVRVFASGFEGETLQLAIQFTRYSLIGLLFMGVTHLFRSYLQLKGNFAAPALVALPMNIVIISSIIISSFWDIRILSIGLILSMLAQLIFLIPFVVKKGLRFQPIFDIKDKNIKQMIPLALPVLVGVAVEDLNKIIDKTIASNVAIGGISALSYSINLNNFVHGVFVLSITSVMYPVISKMAIEGNISGLKKSIIESIEIISLFLVPTMIGIMIFSKPIIELLYGRGAFGDNAITMTSQVLFYYSFGLLSVGIREVLSRPFYALQDTKTPVINASVGVIVNITLNLILSRYLGIGGLALATSLSSVLTAILMYQSLKKKIGIIDLTNTYMILFKVLIASVIMGFVVYGLNIILIQYTSSNVSLFISIIFGALLYFSLLIFLKVKIVNKVKIKFINKLLSINQQK